MTRRTKILILIIILLVILDICLALDQANRARCTDISDPRYNPPAETCGLAHATPPSTDGQGTAQ